MELLDFCYDVLIHILQEINPADLASCAQTSWAFHNFVKGNQRLYRAHYLQNFDDPRRDSHEPEPNWVELLQQAVKCQKILESDSAEVKRDNFKFVAAVIESLLDSASARHGGSRNRAQLLEIFEQQRNVDAILCRSSLYKYAGTESQQATDDEDDQQLSAKLHCMYGIPRGALGRRSLSTHPHARSRVYDLRNYTDANKWGPFRNDNSLRVDWEMMESIMIDLGYNCEVALPQRLLRLKPVWCSPFGGITGDSKRVQRPLTIPVEPDIPLELKDPYNVTGIWHRVVCFLDYNDLYAFNFRLPTPPPDQPRGALKIDEAIRPIIMKLEVTEIELPGQFDNQSLPIVHFKGFSRSMDMSWDPNANSRLRGKVRLTPEGEVRWSTISIFSGGEERWRSEGIQVGGINSKRGVTGTWFEKDYDVHGPAGPTAFWKVSDSTEGFELDEGDSEDDSDHASEDN